MFSNYKITWHFTQVFCKAVSIGKIKIRLNILKSSVFVCFSQALKSLLTMYFYKIMVNLFLKCLCLLFNENLSLGHAFVYAPPCSSNFMRPLSLQLFVFLWSTKWGGVRVGRTHYMQKSNLLFSNSANSCPHLLLRESHDLRTGSISN